MKRLCSIILVLCMIPTMLVPAFAAKTCDCGRAPVIYVHGFGKPLYIEDETGSERIYPPTTEKFKETTATIVLAVLALALNQYRLFATLGMRAAENLLGRIGCDPSGVPLDGTGLGRIALPSTDVHGKMQVGIADYSFAYDWRLSPLDNAQKLHDYVQHICALTGHDKVSLVCHSMGGTVLAAYLYAYGGGQIDRMIALAPAWQGLSIMGSLLSGEAVIADKAEQLDLFLRSVPTVTNKWLKALIRVCGMIGIYEPILGFLQRPLDDQFDRVYDECLRGMFGTMPGMWAFVPDVYYERAKTYSFGDDDTYAALIEKIDQYHYNVQNHLVDLLRDATDKGMQLEILSGYGISSMPLSYAHTVQSDILIDTVYTSIGAVAMPYGETLSASYKQAVADGHDHVSPDMLIDASTCAFPEQTWFVRGMMHFDFPYDAVDFVRWVVAQPSQPSVWTDAEFPQFLAWDKETGFSPVTE